MPIAPYDRRIDLLKARLAQLDSGVHEQLKDAPTRAEARRQLVSQVYELETIRAEIAQGRLN